MDGGQRQPLRLGPRQERWFDVALTAVLLLPVPVMLLGDPLAGMLMLVQITPLAARRAAPVPVFVLVAAGSALQALLIDLPLWSQVAFPIATYSVARFASAGWGFVALGTGLVGAVVAAVRWLDGFGNDSLRPETFASYFLTIGLIVLVAWALGSLGRTRQAYVDTLIERGERLQREAAQQAALAAVEERQRIAREMHDVVAHGLTTIVVQADGARAAAARDPAVAGTALATIAEAGRDAIAEMRRMLGLLRGDAGSTVPQPRLTDLHRLLAEVRASGTRVDATLPEPLPTVTDGVALTAYRVVQEALSNVRRHAGPGATAVVSLTADDDLVVVRVEDDGRGASSVSDGRGLGITGMRERVSAHGGTLEVGPRSTGGFTVCARIPR